MGMENYIRHRSFHTGISFCGSTRMILREEENW
jgi:hypothetical protein